MKKLLHERLREAAKNGVSSIETCDRNIVVSLLKDEELSLADEIEKYYIPRPRFDDGEPVQFGDEFADCSGNPHTLHEIRYRDKAAAGLGAKCLLEANTTSPKDYDGISFNLYDDAFVKRPESKVLDADGVPTKKGDKVWSINNPEMKMTVDNFQQIYGQDVTVNCEFEGEFYNFNPDKLTHREPDSLEKLRDDMIYSIVEGTYPGTAHEYLCRCAKRLTAIMECDA